MAIALASLIDLLGCARTTPTAEPSPSASLPSVAAVAPACPWRSLDDVVLESRDDVSSSLEPLRPEQWAEDLACLRRTLKHQYVATDYYANHGIDLLARLDALAGQLDGPIAPTALLESLLALHDGARDVHLGYALEWSEGGERKQRYASQPRELPYWRSPTLTASAEGDRGQEDPALMLRSCEGLRPVEALVDGEGRRAVVLMGSFPFEGSLDDRPVTCTDSEGATHSLSARVVVSRGEVRRDPITYEQSGDHLYVRIPYMSSDETAREQEVLDIILAEDAPRSVLVDLRTNPGGDDEFAFRLSAALRLRDEALPESRMIDVVSLQALTASANLSRLMNDAASEQHYLDELRQLQATGQAFDDPPRIQPGEEWDKLPRRGLREKPYRGRIGLLVDRRCASSCESMVELLADLDQVEVLGTHTAGAVSFGNVGVTALPHSRIQFVGGWRHFDHGDIEGVGYAPDVYIVAEDPVAAATHYLRHETLAEAVKP